MKTTYTTIILAIVFFYPIFWGVAGGDLNAQNVYIPDANFKAALVNNPDINTNGDTAIQVSEAATYTLGISVNDYNIIPNILIK